MYKRHSIWDEDKWDIHSSGSSGYAGHGSESKGAGYAGHSSKDSTEEYHKNEVYSAGKPDEDKIKSSYGSNEQKEDDKKKEDEEKEKTIVDTVEQEEKYQKEERQEEEFKNIAKDSQQGNIEHERMTGQNTRTESGTNFVGNKNIKKKQNESIEEAIKEAIKEEKEIVHVD